MTVLVTGGLGYIGSHIVFELSKINNVPIIIDNLSNSNLTTLKRIKKIFNKKFIFYKVDIRDEMKLDEIFSKHKITNVIHLAGAKSVPESHTDPIKYYSNNFAGSLTLLKIMTKYKVFKIIFSSSATVYGNTKKNPIKENHILKPISPYGNSKKMIEESFRDLSKINKEFTSVSLRYFNPIGFNREFRGYDRVYLSQPNLIPNIINTALGKKKNLLIYGKDYASTDGTCIRDFIHIKDLVNGHIKAMIFSMKNRGNFEFNLGTGQGTTVLQLVSSFKSINKVKLPYLIRKKRNGDAFKLVACTKLARSKLGWKAKYDIEDMCKDSYFK